MDDNITQVNSTNFTIDLIFVNDTTETLMTSKLQYNTSPMISTAQRSIIQHYKDNHSRSLIKSNQSLVKGIRNALDQPLAGLIVIGSLFFIISLLLALIVFIFYKKRNTVFVYEKSQHNGLYSSAQDRSIVIGQTKQARQIHKHTMITDGNNSVDSSNDEDDYDDEEDTEIEYNLSLFNENGDDNGGGGGGENHMSGNEIELKSHNVKASYVVRPKYEILQNPQCILKLSDNMQNSLRVNDGIKNYGELSVENIHKTIRHQLKHHENHLFVYNGQVIRNPRFVLCPKHAHLLNSQNKSVRPNEEKRQHTSTN
ncbi:unnamed protein product [Trichobilharzia szidati]|nr:unnamed protein product [Trichobilharzia szidati]